MDRFTLNVIKGPVLVGLRYDVDMSFEKEEENFLYRPRKYFLQINQRGLSLQLGDFYSSLGRGILLNVLKNDEFGEDTSIQGQQLSIDTDYILFRGLAGVVNPGDPIRFTPEQTKVVDPLYRDRDLLWGGQAVVSWPGVVSVGALYAGAVIRTDELFETPEFEQDNSTSRFGVSLEFPDIFGVGSFYAEYAWLGLLNRRQGGLDDSETEGRALYFVVDMYLHNFDLMIEGKDYFNAAFKYAEGPSLEYQKMVFELADYNDEIGLRGRLGYRIPSANLYFYINYLHTKTHEQPIDSLKDHYDQSKEFEWADRVKHLYGGVEMDFPHAGFLDASVGYREEQNGRWLHAELDGQASILPRHSVQAIVQYRQFQGLGFLESVRYGSQLFQMAYNWSPYLVITANYEHSDEPFAGSTGTGNVGTSGGTREDFYFGEVKVKPTDDVTITGFYGSSRGGLKCSGGVCREVPSFEGFKLDVSLRF